MGLVNIPTHFRDRAHFSETKRAVGLRIRAIAPEGIASPEHVEEEKRLRAWLVANAEWAEIHTMTDHAGTVRLRYAVRCF